MATKSRKSLLNFNGGIWSSKLDGRIDLERYSNACRQMENFIIRPFGMAERRPGSEFICPTKNGAAAELWPFQFNKDQGYIIEVGNQYMRFFTNGDAVTTSFSISTASWTAGVATYTLATAHSWVVGDYITVTGITPSGYNVTKAKIVGLSGSFDINVNIESDPGSYSSGGSMAGPYEIATPFLSADLAELQFRQINDIVLITHESYKPRRLTRLTSTTFEVTEEEFNLPPMRDENVSDITLNPGATTGTGISLSASAPAWVSTTFYSAGIMRSNGGSIYESQSPHTAGTFATDLANGLWKLHEVFTSGNVGGYFRLGHRREASSLQKQLWDQSAPATNLNGSTSYMTILGGWQLTTSGVWNGTIQIERRDPITGNVEVIYEANGRDGERNLSAAGDELVTTELRITFSNWANVSTAGAADAYAYLEASDAIVYGYAEVATVTNATTATINILSDLEASSATDIWAESSWSTRRGNPKSVDLYELRTVYAGNTAEPLAIWGSVINDFSNFDYGTGEDDRAFSYTIPSTEQNPIEWIVGGKAILVGTGKDYGILSSGSDDLPITPSNVQFRIQEAVGYTNIKPEIVGPIFAGVERNGRRLREIAYKFDEGVSGGYKANDLNRLSDELTEQGIKKIAYTQLREPYIYCVLNDGNIACLAYNRDDGIAGWSKWTTQGDYESIATINGTDNDEVWVIVERNIAGLGTLRYIERFNPTTWTDVEDAFYVDCGKTVTGSSMTTISGLEHLFGEAVQVLGDGSPQTSDLSVASGLIDAEGDLAINGDGVDKAHVGLQFETILEPMRLDIDSAIGSSHGRSKAISHVNVRYYKSVGVSFNNGIEEFEIPFNDTTDLMGVAVPLFTGEKRQDWPTTLGINPRDNDPKLILKQTKPLPLSLIAVIVFYAIS